MKKYIVHLKSGKNVVLGSAAAVATFLTQAAHAAIDVTGVTTVLSDGTTAATTIGTAALGVFALIGIFVWLRRPVK